MAMDLIAALRSFVRVAETGSFSAVSVEAQVTQPTISRQIAMLEQHFGVRLFNRTTRKLIVTEDGRTLLALAREIEETLEEAETAFGRRRASPSGIVRLSCPTAFGFYLIGQLGRFAQRYPDISLDLVMRESFGDLIEEGLDLAVRVGPLSESALISRRIGSIERVLVSTPDYLDRAGIPDEPRDLRQHSCIAYAYNTPDRSWIFHQAGREVRIPVSGVFRSNNSEAAQRAVLAGLGIGLLPVILVAPEVVAGRLVRVMPDWESPALPIHIVHSGPRALPLRIRTVVGFLTQISAEMPTPERMS
jgi:DNA-binding transcriptional LysR family regulator